ncbi:hypothetical protein N9L06_05685 [Mariniblastus sp.]|nr:hypothetical protein [Mariniblastus sp.]
MITAAFFLLSFPVLAVGCIRQTAAAAQTSQRGESRVNVAKTDSSSPDSANVAYSVTQGRAKQKGEPLLECDVKGWRVTAVGTIADAKGHVWTTPAEVAFSTGPKATDLFNECSGITLANAKTLDLSTVPIVDVDADGEVFTTYFFGDNYAEIYVNGKLIGIDPVPYWPFNTSVVRYRVKRPFVLGAKLVDWEENLSLGSEIMHGVPFHNGDGGFTAVTKNARDEVVDLTDESWRVQIFYCSPLLNPNKIVDTSAKTGAKRNSDACASPEKNNAEESYAVRWPLPKNWSAKGFDDSQWSKAKTYTNEEIGGSLNRPAYANFSSLFDAPENDAQFIWSSNLLLDNLVLARKVIE